MELDDFLKQDVKKEQVGSDSNSRELENSLGHIWEIALEFGLDPFSTHFEIIPADIMHEIGSYGLPGRFSHWTHGRIFRQLKTQYDYGLGKIYEVVINSDPAQAYLMENNDLVANKMVMAHVLGHTDFFKNSLLFGPTRKDMPDGASITADRFRLHEQKFGKLKIEKFLDAVLSVSEHIDSDPKKVYRASKEEQIKNWREEFKASHRRPPSQSEYAFLDELDPKTQEKELNFVEMPMPLKPEKDLLAIVRDFAPDLEDWQRDIVDGVRLESIYFVPQMMTKISNEGWASFWHKRIMHEMSDRDLISQGDNITWARMHSGVLAPNPKRLNPYMLGMNMFEWVKDYHNGWVDENEKMWLQNQGLPIYPKYEGDEKESPGMKKIFELRMIENDQSLMRNYFSKVAADRMHLYVYEEKESRGDKWSEVKDKSWEIIRDNIVNSLNNCGYPYILVQDINFARKGELYLKHVYEGQTLDIKYLEKVLPYIHRLWGRGVHLETVVKDKSANFYFDGEKIATK